MTRRTPTPLTALLPLRAGSEDALRSVLLEIGNDVGGTMLRDDPAAPFIDFERTPTHFARLVVLPDPDRGPGRHRLLFAAVHDGPRGRYLAGLVGATRCPDAIWGACEGYPGASELGAFLARHAIETEAYYVAFRDQALEDVRRLSSEASAFDSALERGQLPHDAEPPRRSAPLGFLRGLLRTLARAPGLALDALRVVWRRGLRHTFGAGLEIAASLDRYRLLRWLNRLTGNRMTPLHTAHSQLTLDGCRPCQATSEADEVVDAGRQWSLQRRREDRVAQNQLTLVTVNDPERLARLEAVMAVIGLYSRRLSPPGSLAGISTIHFVRWGVIDEGRRLIMISDYDGSWEAYIEEFAEMILSGLDAIWTGSVGYPRGGARDLHAFKRFLRCRQYQAEVFYSGYPGETVLNLLAHRDASEWRARELARATAHG